MQLLDRITFLTPDKQEEFEFEKAYDNSSEKRIIVHPVSYPKKDVRDWDVIASNNGDIEVDGRVISIEEKTAVQSPRKFGNCLLINYIDKL